MKEAILSGKSKDYVLHCREVDGRGERCYFGNTAWLTYVDLKIKGS